MNGDNNVDHPRLTSISLFSGAAGLDLGLSLSLSTDVRTVAFVEREAYACEVLLSRMEAGDLDPAPVWTDVTSFDGLPFRGLVDIVAGGFPCQDISNAGKREGITGRRSGLWSEFARIVAEVEPRLVVIENVAALRTKGLEVVLSDLASLGYDAEWGTFRASDVGATHQRDRLFIVAYCDGGRLARERLARVREGEHGQGALGGYDTNGSCGSALADTTRNGRGQGGSEPDAEGEAVSCESSAELLADDERGRWGQVRSESEPELSGSEVTAPEGTGGEQLLSASNCSRCEGYGCSDRVPEEVPWTLGYFPPPPDAIGEWTQVIAERQDLEPSVRRVADGLAYRVDRLRLTGNGVVPAQAAVAVRKLLRRLTTKQ